ncbi:MAG: ATP phosphoribosyltransferase regulatory subunit [Acidobacteriota bacterium]
MKVTASLPTGVAALLFDGARRRRRLEEEMVARLESNGFAEVILPVVDYLDPYVAMLSAHSRSELYRFVDRSGEVLALRADFTPMLARLLAPRLASLELPLRLFYRGDVLRYQEERAGRQRELYQLGAEVLGLPGEEAEEVAIDTCLGLLAAGERRRLVVVLGFAGALDRLILDCSDDFDPHELVDAVGRRERRHARRAGAALLDVVERGVPDDPSALGAAAAARLERLEALRGRLASRHPSVDLRIDLAEFADQVTDPALAERLGARAYYDGLVFRAFAGAAAEPVGNGGRYDRLFHSLGAELTAAGFSVSLDRLIARDELESVDEGGVGDGRDGPAAPEDAR